MKCKKCGSDIMPGVTICGVCGEVVEATEASTPETTPTPVVEETTPAPAPAAAETPTPSPAPDFNPLPPIGSTPEEPKKNNTVFIIICAVLVVVIGVLVVLIINKNNDSGSDKKGDDTKTTEKADKTTEKKEDPDEKTTSSKTTSSTTTTSTTTTTKAIVVSGGSYETLGNAKIYVPSSYDKEVSQGQVLLANYDTQETLAVSVLPLDYSLLSSVVESIVTELKNSGFSETGRDQSTYGGLKYQVINGVMSGQSIAVVLVEFTSGYSFQFVVYTGVLSVNGYLPTIYNIVKNSSVQ